jgi:uncharacterized protein YndB with AHSA1/START domain
MPDDPKLTTLVVRRTLAAPASAVFRAWTDPAFVSQWSWGSEHETLGLQMDVRVNGAWKHEIKNRNTGDRWSFDGVYQEIVPDRRLVHTFFWRSDKGIEEGPSLVEIEFTKKGEDQTEVVITHRRLSPSSKDGTQSGWNDCLNEIEKAAKSVMV